MLAATSFMEDLEKSRHASHPEVLPSKSVEECLNVFSLSAGCESCSVNPGFFLFLIFRHDSFLPFAFPTSAV